MVEHPRHSGLVTVCRSSSTSTMGAPNAAIPLSNPSTASSNELVPALRRWSAPLPSPSLMRSTAVATYLQRLTGSLSTGSRVTHDKACVDTRAPDADGGGLAVARRCGDERQADVVPVEHAPDPRPVYGAGTHRRRRELRLGEREAPPGAAPCSRSTAVGLGHRRQSCRICSRSRPSPHEAITRGETTADRWFAGTQIVALVHAARSPDRAEPSKERLAMVHTRSQGGPPVNRTGHAACAAERTVSPRCAPPGRCLLHAALSTPSMPAERR